MFAGSEKLRSHYKSIGDSLLQLEERTRPGDFLSADVCFDFRQSVAFVPVEVLESYLEDLLNLEVDQERLFIMIAHRGTWNRAFKAVVALSVACLSAGMLFLLTDLLPGVQVMAATAVFCGVIWYLFPPHGEVRRMRFAQIVSREVARRRGIDKDRRSPESSRDMFERLLGRETARLTHGGAAMIVYH